ncbi:hypothetical protein VKT23_013218 [Stygiomarasmius scandens]|uniref:Fungal-type protein kinase domain-containing protein n=1 Tax=Marasmiellus scandens TaxID=2682957 RepID=A0ABR1J8S9_9AGAR
MDYGSHKDGITGIFNDLDGNIGEVAHQDFTRHHFGRTLSDTEVKSCIDCLEEEKSIVWEGKWMPFTMMPPDSDGENAYFAKLVEVVESICEWYRKFSGCSRSSDFTVESHQTTNPEIPGASFEVDARFHPRNSSSKRYSSDFVAPCGFRLKRNKADVEDNRRKLAGAAAHLLNSDPCRRHVYGMTIEQHEVRLWYFSRSHCVKSTPFDLHSQLDPLIRFIVALSFGTHEELGFDPTVKRMHLPGPDSDNPEIGQEVFYVYQVDGRFYRTTRSLCEYFPASFTGRATRVWAVRECTEDGDVEKGAREQVVKDCWLDEGGEREWQIQREIFARLKVIRQDVNSIASKLPSDLHERRSLEAALQHFEEYFVEIAAYELISTTSTIHDSFKRSTVMDDDLKETQSRPAQVHSRYALHKPNLSVRAFSKKHQCRVVYSHCFETIALLTNSETIAAAMYDCVMASHLLYLAGFVHRDISSGNVYYGTSGANSEPKGKLSDFEYARLFNPDQRDRIGTEYFMAVDVKAGTYVVTSTTRTPPFRYDFLHDVESTFWLALFLYTTRTAIPLSFHDIMVHRAFVHDVFTDYFQRLKILRLHDYRQNQKGWGITFEGQYCDPLPDTFFDATIPEIHRQTVFQVFTEFCAKLALAHSDLSLKRDQETAYKDCFKLAKDAFSALRTKLGSLPMTTSYPTSVKKPSTLESNAITKDGTTTRGLEISTSDQNEPRNAEDLDNEHSAEPLPHFSSEIKAGKRKASRSSVQLEAEGNSKKVRIL